MRLGTKVSYLKHKRFEYITLNVTAFCLKREDLTKMKIHSMRIQKFRSINDSTIIFQQILALVGANNVGKSHVLRALNSFFNYDEERENFLNEAHLYSKQSRPRITVTFDEITTEDGIDDEYLYNGKLVVKFTYRWDRKNPTYSVVKGADNKNIDAGTFKKLMEHFTYVYIPIIRDYDAAFSHNGGVAYRLLRQIFQTQTANRNNLQPAADRLITKVENSIYKPALLRIKQYYPFKNGQDFKMHARNADLIDLILRNVSLLLLEDSQENGIDNCGSGIQSAVFFAISIALAITDHCNYLVGIEEPELNMHPQAQRQLIEALKKEKNYPHTQFILTTHSTVIIDRLGHEAIALCRKNKGEKRDIVTTITQTGQDFLERYNLEEERYYSFFDFKNSDFFFSNFIIITESANDCKVVQHLLEMNGVDIETLGISFIPLEGERNIKYPYAIATELKIPFICVVDRDVFQAYKYDKRELSLNDEGIPEYKDELKSGSHILELINEQDKAAVLAAFCKEKYRDALLILEKYHIVAMRYAIEVDLIACPSYCTGFCNVLRVMPDNQNKTYLLKNMGKTIKRYTTINAVVDSQGTKNLPLSYRQIINCVKKWLNNPEEK